MHVTTNLVVTCMRLRSEVERSSSQAASARAPESAARDVGFEELAPTFG